MKFIQIASIVLSVSAFETDDSAPSAGDADISSMSGSDSLPDPSSIGGGGRTLGATDNSQKVACEKINDPICPVETHCCGTARLPPVEGNL